jgi:two-component system sensor histidine kinase SenX3
VRRGAQVRARVAAVLARLGAGTDFGTVPAGLDRIDQSVTELLARSAADAMAVDRLLAALAALPQGIVVADHLGQVVVRNPAASAFVEARHGDALVESAIGELIEASLSGEGTTRTLELFGPPRRVLDLRVVPLLRRPPRGSAGSARPVVLGAMAVIDDVSERQRLDAVRRDFVANISHELKTPIGALGVLAETLAGETDPEVVARLAERMQPRRSAWPHHRRPAPAEPDRGRRAARAESVPVRQVLAEAVDRTRAAAELQGVDPPRRRAAPVDRRGRPPPARLRARQPARQRGQVLRPPGPR